MNERTMSPPIEGWRAEPRRAAALPDATTKDPGAVAWSAVLAGAAAAAALSLILVVLGVGLGLSSVSPWSGQGLSAASFGVSTILWLTFAQLAASGMGGYLAGRLRHRWLETTGDETYFRDTAHGFLAWAVASLATAAVLGSAFGAILNGGVQAGAAAAPAAAMSQGSGYVADALFRRPAGAAGAGNGAGNSAAEAGTGAAAGAADAGAPPAEVTRILANAAREGALPADDAKYLAQLISQRTGIPAADAEKRVSDAVARTQAAADKARKATAYASLWLFVSLLAGAFVASLAATRGGRRRDLF